MLLYIYISKYVQIFYYEHRNITYTCIRTLKYILENKFNIMVKITLHDQVLLIEDEQEFSFNNLN